MRLCKKCGSVKSGDVCKPCHAAYQREWKEKNHERALEINKKWRDNNAEKHREASRDWYAANPERAREYRAAWRSNNKERKREMARQWYQKNKLKLAQKLRETADAWRKDNKARSLKSARVWAKKNAGKILAKNHNRRARVRGCNGKHTVAQILDLLRIQNKRCAACATGLATKGKAKYHVDHVMPIARGGSNDISNIQLLCPSCNSKKSDLPPEDWAKNIGRLFV